MISTGQPRILNGVRCLPDLLVPLVRDGDWEIVSWAEFALVWGRGPASIDSGDWSQGERLNGPLTFAGPRFGDR